MKKEWIVCKTARLRPVVWALIQSETSLEEKLEIAQALKQFVRDCKQANSAMNLAVALAKKLKGTKITDRQANRFFKLVDQAFLLKR
jgi:hypothetical protein